MSQAFRFGTYNVQHCLSYMRHLADPTDKQIRPDDIAAVILREGVDVCALQEIDVGTGRCGGKNLLEELLSLLSAKTGEKWQGHFAKAIAFGGGEYGVALVSRFPVREVRTRPVALPASQKTPDARFEDRVLQIATLEIGTRVCTLINTHFGLMPAEQELILRFVGEEVALCKIPLLLAGDLNATPDSCTISALEKMLLRAGGDPLPKTHPSHAPQVTIDYIFHNAAFCVRNLRAPDYRCSDHRPVFAEIEFS